MNKFLTDLFTKNILFRPLIALRFGVMATESKETDSEQKKTYHSHRLIVLTADIHFIGTVMKFKKPRLRSKANLNFIRALPCMICEKGPVDPDHWKTKGSGGDDELTNLSPLCRTHHIEKGAIGVRSFYERYEQRILTFRDKYELPPLKRKLDA